MARVVNTTLVGRLDGMCQRVEAVMADGETRDHVRRIRVGLGLPLRVVVAGRVSSGKSTLVNALLGQRVARTDVSECTRYVTSYRYGVPERLVVHTRDGAEREIPLAPDGSLPPSPGLGVGPVEGLEVHLANDTLKRLVLIDTPGLGSPDDERSADALSVLGLDPDARLAVAEGDALLFVLTGSLRGDEARVLEAHGEALAGSTASTLSTMSVLNKADLLGDGDEDPLVAARLAAARFADALREVVSDVEPVISLLAETADTGRFGEPQAEAIRALAGLPSHERRALLLSVDRLRTADAAVPTSARQDLVGILGFDGVIRAVTEVDEGRGDAASLLTWARDRSGVARLRRKLLRFAADSDALKAAGALAALERIAYTMTDAEDQAARAELLDQIDEVRIDPAMHRIEELRALRGASARDLPADLLEALRRIVVERRPARRLGLVDDATPDQIAPAATESTERWIALRNDPRSTTHQQWLADVMTRSCEHIWAATSTSSNPPADQ